MASVDYDGLYRLTAQNLHMAFQEALGYEL